MSAAATKAWFSTPPYRDFFAFWRKSDDERRRRVSSGAPQARERDAPQARARRQARDTRRQARDPLQYMHDQTHDQGACSARGARAHE